MAIFTTSVLSQPVLVMFKRVGFGSPDSWNRGLLDDCNMNCTSISAVFRQNLMNRRRYFFWADTTPKNISSSAGRMGWDSSCAREGCGFM